MHRKPRCLALLPLIAVISISSVCRRAPDSNAAAARHDVVLITLDTLRADHMTPDLMPVVTRLAADGAQFTATRTVAPLTLPAHVSLMTGLNPPRHGVRLNGGRGLSPDVPMLARAMHDAGYDTAAFVAAFVLDRRFGLAVGFRDY